MKLGTAKTPYFIIFASDFRLFIHCYSRTYERAYAFADQSSSFIESIDGLTCHSLRDSIPDSENGQSAIYPSLCQKTRPFCKVSLVCQSPYSIHSEIFFEASGSLICILQFSCKFSQNLPWAGGEPATFYLEVWHAIHYTTPERAIAKTSAEYTEDISPSGITLCAMEVEFHRRTVPAPNPCLVLEPSV